MGAGVPPQLQYADVPGTETTAAQPGKPPWPGVLVGAVPVLTGRIVDAGSEVYAQFAEVAPAVGDRVA